MNFVGFPWDEVEPILGEQNIVYHTEITRPLKRDVFKIEDTSPYVVREKKNEDESFTFVLAYPIKNRQ